MDFAAISTFARTTCGQCFASDISELYGHSTQLTLHSGVQKSEITCKTCVLLCIIQYNLI